MSNFISGVGVCLIVQALWSMVRADKSARIRFNEEGYWEFPMDTLAQMVAIPVERRGRFLAELPGMFRNMWDMADKIPFKTAKGAVWVDDGKGEFRPRVVNMPNGAEADFRDRPL